MSRRRRRVGRFRYPSEEQATVEFYAAWPVSAAPGGEIWPKDNPFGPVIAGNRIGEGQAFIIGDTAFALKKNFDAFSPNAELLAFAIEDLAGHGRKHDGRTAK